MKTKNLLLSIAMLAAGLSSCSRSDALDGVAVTGETAVVVSAAVPAELNGTRSGEGSEINRCQMEIYLDGVLCGERQVAEVTATFSVASAAARPSSEAADAPTAAVVLQVLRPFVSPVGSVMSVRSAGTCFASLSDASAETVVVSSTGSTDSAEIAIKS